MQNNLEFKVKACHLWGLISYTYSVTMFQIHPRLIYQHLQGITLINCLIQHNVKISSHKLSQMQKMTFSYSISALWAQSQFLSSSKCVESPGELFYIVYNKNSGVHKNFNSSVGKLWNHISLSRQHFSQA